MTEETYWEQVGFIESENPKEPLLDLLKQQFCKANYKIYLPFALARIVQEIHEAEDNEEVSYHVSDSEKEELLRQYGRAYGEACKLSNKLHEFNCQKADTQLIENILEVQHRIDVISDKLNGTFKELETKEAIVLEGEGKYRRILSLRANISRKKKELENLIGSDDKALIEKKEKQLFDYKIELNSLENKDI